MTTQSRPLRRLAALAAIQLMGVLLCAGLSVAEEAEGPHHGSIADLTSNYINFSIYLALLYVLLRKVVPNAWAARREKIRDTVLSSKAELEEAERELAAVEALTQSLARDQERAKREILEQAELEATALKSAAVERAARIKAQAKELLAGEGRSAELQVRASLVARALEIAKSRFAAGAFAERQQSYVDAAIGRAKRLVQ